MTSPSGRNTPVKFSLTENKIEDFSLKCRSKNKDIPYQQRVKPVQTSRFSGSSPIASQSQLSPITVPFHRPPSTFSDVPQVSIFSDTGSHSISRVYDPSSGSSGFISGGTMSSSLLQQRLRTDGPLAGSINPSTPYLASHYFQVRDTFQTNMSSPALLSPTALSVKDMPSQQFNSSPSFVSRVREPFVEPSNVHLNMSAGEPYEFDTPSFADPDISQLRREQLRWRHWQTWQRDRNLASQRAKMESSASDHLPVTSERSLGDAAIYGSIGQRFSSYKAPRNMSLEAMEARCSQLRREFQNFRQRQAELDLQRREARSQLSRSQVAPTNSNFSDEFESAC